MRLNNLPPHLESRIVSEISTTTALKEKSNTSTRTNQRKRKENDLTLLTEHQEQCLVIAFCDIHHIPIFAIPNGSNKSKIQAHNFKLEGLRAGVPDLCVPLMRNGYGSLYIEMKRKKKSTVSIEQKAWIALLNSFGHKAVVCYGSDEAIEVIKGYIGGVK
jgi:hypothetical protein